MKGNNCRRETSKQKQKFCLPSVPKYQPLDEKIENNYKVVDNQTVRLFELSKLQTGLGSGNSSIGINKSNIFSKKFDKQKNNKKDFSQKKNKKNTSGSHVRYNSSAYNNEITELMRDEMELLNEIMDTDEDKKFKFIKNKKIQKLIDRDIEYRIMKEKYNRKKEKYFSVKIKKRLNSVCWNKSRGNLNLNLVIPAKKVISNTGSLFLTGDKIASSSDQNIFSNSKEVLKGYNRRKKKFYTKAKSLSSLYERTENPEKINSLFFQIIIYYEKQKKNILAKNLQKEKEEKLKIIKERKMKDKYYNPYTTSNHENPRGFKKISSLHKAVENSRFLSPLKDQYLSTVVTQTIPDQKINREYKEEQCICENLQ